MRSHGLIHFIGGALVLFGIFALTRLNKDEFPQFTIRQGVVAAVYPGASAEEIEEQVTKPLEHFLFTYQEVNKNLTYSVTENGIVYVFVELRTSVRDKDEVWSKIRHGLQLFKKTSLPAGVLEVVVVDDFGNTSSMLLAVESDQRTPRELELYPQIYKLMMDIVDEVFSADFITPGVTTTTDVEWGIMQRVNALGLPCWFSPDVNL